MAGKAGSLAYTIERVTAWAAIECDKQQSGEMSVSWMVAGWAYTSRHRLDPVSVDHIQRIGSIVEPRKNRMGQWRQTSVRVGDSIKPSWQEVPRLMDALIEAWRVVHPDEWYREFEEIHPFADGNGRTGNILWNWAHDTLQPWKVKFPPDYWGFPRLSLATWGGERAPKESA